MESFARQLIHPQSSDKVLSSMWSRALARVQAPLAVGSPVPLVLAGIGIKNNDAPIKITDGNEQFIRLWVYELAGRSTQVLGIVAAPVLSYMADLHEELPLRGELQDLVVFLRVSAEPDVIFRIDEDSVLGRKPFVALSRATPRLEGICRSCRTPPQAAR
jgi:hypothetical protein